MFNCIIRVDASVTMGSGHVMRCLTLADSLRTENVTVNFISRQLPGNMNDYIESKGYKVHKLPYNPKSLGDKIDNRTIWSGECWQKDMQQTLEILKGISNKKEIKWLIIDHYGLDAQWEQAMRKYVHNIMVIDDLADRKHDCNLLLDQNLYLDMQVRYNDLIPKHCESLLGPEYALLRQEFYEARQKAKVRDGNVKRVLVFFGGSDPTNETIKALQALSLVNKKDINIDVVVGEINPHKEEVKQYCNKFSNFNFHCQVNNMAELMVNADLAIGAGGSATWERCYLGLPTLIITVAKNQVEIAKVAALNSLCKYIGNFDSIDNQTFIDTLIKLINSGTILNGISKECFEKVQGLGLKKIIIKMIR